MRRVGRAVVLEKRGEKKLMILNSQLAMNSYYYHKDLQYAKRKNTDHIRPGEF